MTEPITAIHEFWFAQLDEKGLCSPQQQALWFKASASTDQSCRETFADRVAQALAGELDHWADTDPGLVALILLLDQFTRNIFRGTPRALAGDSRALDLALRAIACGANLRLLPIHRVFLYMPLEHAEDPDIQQQCVDLFADLSAQADHSLFSGFSRYAVAHRDVIAQFGRFPHRNSILGRESTAGELRYLETHGGF